MVIAASGPSQRKEDLELVRKYGARLIVINETWRLAPWADVLYACDQEWWELRGPAKGEFGGLRIIGKGSHPGCIEANVRAGTSFMFWAGDEIGAGGNGTFQALNLVARWGAKRVILTGLDCKGCHWHGPHGKGLKTPTPHTMAGWIKSFELAAPDLERHGVTVLNATRDTALDCFQRVAIEDVL